MRFRAVHMVLAILAAMLWVSCKQGPRRIPRGKMVDIYAEMFLQDQVIRQNQDLRKKADSILVYEGIFREYGYDTDDYLFSVEYYLRDPERMAKIMDDVAIRMNVLARELDDDVELYEWREEMMALYNKPVSDKLPQPVSMVDTLKIAKDESGSGPLFSYRPEEMPDLDTLVLKMK